MVDTNSRKGTIRAAGRIWHNDGECFSTDINERVFASTWKFGSIHQCKVFVRYPCNMRTSQLKVIHDNAQVYLRNLL